MTDVYIVAQRTAIPRLPGEDVVLIRGAVQCCPEYSATFRLDTAMPLSCELLEESDITRIRQDIKNFPPDEYGIDIVFAKGTWLESRDRNTLIDFLREQSYKNTSPLSKLCYQK